MVGLSHFTARDASGHKRYEREGLVEWARQRFEVDLDLEDLKNRQRDEIRDLLIEHSRQYAATTVDPQVEVQTRLKQVFNGQSLSPKVAHRGLGRRPPQGACRLAPRRPELSAGARGDGADEPGHAEELHGLGRGGQVPARKCRSWSGNCS